MYKGAHAHTIVVLTALVAAIALVYVGSAALAQEAEEENLIRLQLRDADIVDVFTLLGQAADVGIAVGEGISGRVKSVTLHDEPIEKALDIVCRIQGLHWEREGKNFLILPGPKPAGSSPKAAPAEPEPKASAEAKRVAVIPEPPETEVEPAVKPAPIAAFREEPEVRTEKYILKWTNARDIAEMFGGGVWGDSIATRLRHTGERAGLGPGVPHYDWPHPPTGANAGGGTSATPPPGYPVFEQLDTGGGLNTGRTRTGGTTTGGYGGYGGGGGSLADLLPEDMEEPIAFLPENALILRGTPEDIDSFREVLEMLDKPIKQIEVSVKIVQIKANKERSLGIEWRLNTGAFRIFNTGLAPPGANTIVNWATGTFDAQLNTALRDGSATVIDEPFIVAGNNQFAQVTFQTSVPFFAAFVSFNQFGQRTVDYQPGIVPVTNQLMARPRVNADESITVFFQVMLSEVVSTVTGPNGETIPSVAYQELYSEIRVGDGDTVVVGGLNRKSDSLETVGIPYLSNLPFIGRLFQSETRSRSDDDVLFFITPRLIHDIATGA